MTTALPIAAAFTGAGVTEAQFKTALTDLRTHLADLLGVTGTQAAALTALGAQLNGVLAKSAAYAVVASDRGKLIDCTTGTWALTLPAVAVGDGFAIAVKNSGSGTITLTPSVPDAIDGASTLIIGAGESAFVVCDGAAWKTVARSGVGAGIVAFFAAGSAPLGWLKANGAAISRATYAALYAVIGTTYGVGDGSTTFNLPDLRGEFVRGLDDGRGVDSGRALGSAQGHAFQSHTHTYPTSNNSGSGYPGYAVGNDVGANASTGSAGSGSETRPRNVALLACIKY